MGVFKTADGRSLVGIGQQDGNEYSGFAGWRDCVIQLTASGATENSVKYLNAIKDYAIAHNAKGESIMPPNLSVWISNNGVTTAVQADDIAVDGSNVTICGIKWDGTAWDYTDAGKGGGGGGASSLAELRDVAISNPQSGQVLMLRSQSGLTVLQWENRSLRIADITDIEQSGVIGTALINTRDGYAFEMLPCFEAYAMDGSSAESLIQVLTMLKSSAKSSGKSGVKIPYPLASGLIALINNIPDSKKKMPMLAIGQYTFNLQSRYSTTMMAFAGTDIDADGVYDISFILDGSAEVGYIIVGYTACPTMS